MITYTFNIEQQGKGIDILKQVAMPVEMRLEIEAATASLTCPNHKFNSSATIRLRGFYYGCKWEVYKPCCSEFRDAVVHAVRLARTKSGTHQNEKCAST